MKIAIIGTHGTFKTTLAYFLAGVLKSKGKTVGIVREVVRACPFMKDGQSSIIAQNWILLTQAQWEREFEGQYDYVICDRGLVDHYVYAQDAYQREKTEVPEWIEPFVMHHANTYNIIFKTPWSPQGLVKDGFRSVDTDWQREMDLKITRFLKDKGIRHIELPEAASDPKDHETIIEYATRQARFMATKILDMDVQTRLEML